MSRCSSIGEKGSWAKGKHAHSPFSLQKQIPSPLSPDIGERVRPSRYPPQPKSRPLSFSAPVVSRHGELELASARRRRGGVLLSRLAEPSGFAVLQETSRYEVFSRVVPGLPKKERPVSQIPRLTASHRWPPVSARGTNRLGMRFILANQQPEYKPLTTWRFRR
jgi:hypothetical protein